MVLPLRLFIRKAKAWSLLVILYEKKVGLSITLYISTVCFCLGENSNPFSPLLAEYNYKDKDFGADHKGEI